MPPPSPISFWFILTACSLPRFKPDSAFVWKQHVRSDLLMSPKLMDLSGRLTCACVVCVAAAQLLQTGIQQEENQIPVSPRWDGGDDRLSAVLAQASPRQPTSQHCHAALLPLHHRVSFTHPPPAHNYIYSPKMSATHLLWLLWLSFVFFLHFSLNPPFTLSSNSSLHPILSRFSPPSASAFAIASFPPFGHQRKSKTVMWSTNTDLGNGHCVCGMNLKSVCAVVCVAVTLFCRIVVFRSCTEFVLSLYFYFGWLDKLIGKYSHFFSVFLSYLT